MLLSQSITNKFGLIQDDHYSNVPLTLGRPSAAQLQHLGDKTAGKLPTWKAHLMNKAGRLAFVKSVLSAIPIHQLLVLAPPKKNLKTLRKNPTRIPMGWPHQGARRQLSRQLATRLPTDPAWGARGARPVAHRLGLAHKMALVRPHGRQQGMVWPRPPIHSCGARLLRVHHHDPRRRPARVVLGGPMA